MSECINFYGPKGRDLEEELKETLESWDAQVLSQYYDPAPPPLDERRCSRPGSPLTDLKARLREKEKEAPSIGTQLVQIVDRFKGVRVKPQFPGEELYLSAEEVKRFLDLGALDPVEDGVYLHVTLSPAAWKKFTKFWPKVWGENGNPIYP